MTIADGPTVEVWLELPDSLHAPAKARKLVAANIHALPQELRADVDILVCEVVTNAVRHGRPDFLLHLLTSPGLVHIDVRDHSADLPTMPAERTSTTDPGGRGLVIVDALATRWGVKPEVGTSGKTVWFDLHHDSHPYE
jgi:anti-sigma regulatory factor (Ser/Thr protein kinase)